MTSPDPYTPPSYRGAILMVVVIVLGIAFLVDIPGVPGATSLDQPAPSLDPPVP